MLKIAWNRFRKNPFSVIGLVIILVLMAAAVFAPYISPYSPTDINVYNVLSPPSASHPLGTDDLGRDVLSRMIWGSRVSLSVGFLAVGISISIGIFFGAIAGYYGGKIDALIMRFVDIMLTIPTYFLILSVISIVEQSMMVIMIIIGLTGWMDVSRLVRAEFLTLKERDFVSAAKAIGASDFRLIFRHIIPNALSPVFVAATFGIAGAILIESSLSFLGLGIKPPDPSWGNILTSGKDNITVAWWLSLFPGLAILVTVLCYNLVGEGLRDSLDPRIWNRDK